VGNLGSKTGGPFFPKGGEVSGGQKKKKSSGVPKFPRSGSFSGGGGGNPCGFGGEGVPGGGGGGEQKTFVFVGVPPAGGGPGEMKRAGGGKFN